MSGPSLPIEICQMILKWRTHLILTSKSYRRWCLREKLTRKWWKRFHLRVKQVTHLAIGTEKYQYSWPNVKYLLRRTEIGYYLKFKKDKFGCERLYRGVTNFYMKMKPMVRILIKNGIVLT